MHRTPRPTLPKQPTCLAILVGIELLSLSYADADKLGQIDIEAFLQDHHHVTKDSRSNEIIHIFANAGPPVFADSGSPASSNGPGRWDIDIAFPSAGVT